jgi:hypothetical protein
VVGDIIVLSTGNEVPADAELLEASAMALNESTLTGEPLCRKTILKEEFDEEATFPSNHVMRGTTVMEGHGVARVFAVGDHTENGKVFVAAQIDNSVKTPLNEQLDGLANKISKISYTFAGIILIARLAAFPWGGDFNTMLLLDTNYKIVFVIFYSAIIYHLAKIMKAKGEKMPRHIAFSGNGSKVIRILTTSDTTLEKFTKKIFEKVYGDRYPTDGLTILQNVNNPKEVTCKGGLANPIKQDYEDIASTKIVFKTVNEGGNNFVSNETYASVDETYLQKVVEEVKAFINFVFDINNDFSFKNNFDSSDSSLYIAKEECVRDLLTYTKNGLENKKKEVSDSDVIEETLFFYPLNGMLNALISAIYSKNNSTKN